jgi:hypothetical protein
VTIPPLDTNENYVVWIRTAASGSITATWTLPPGDRNNIALSVETAFGIELASDRGNVNSLSVTTPSVGAAWYRVIFDNRGSRVSTPTDGTIEFFGACP